MPEKKRTASGVLGGLAGLVGLSAVAGVLITATVTPAIAVSGAAASSAITMFDNMPSYLEIDELMLPSTIYYTNRETGEQDVLTQFYDQNRSPVTFDEVSTVMYDALLSSEDPRYYDHGGVDLIGTTRAALSNLAGSSQLQGGSSISQQYVKNVLIQRCERDATTDDEKITCWEEATNSSGTEGIERKLQEMRYAIALEQQYSKDDILLGYLNIANFGGTNYGIDAAARYYFGVSAAELSLSQAATLAGVVQNPNYYRIDNPSSETNGEANGYALTKERQTYVLGRMLDDAKITQEQYDEAIAAPIEPNITSPSTGCSAAGGAAYFCQYVVSVIRNDPAFGETQDDRDRALRQGGLNIYTTLDNTVQYAGETSMAQNAPTSIDGINFGSTIASVEPGTGRVLAIVQNTKFSEDASLAEDPNYSSLVYAGDSTFGNSDGFPAGSTFKLFTLVDWLENGNSVNEVLNGRLRVIDRLTNTCDGDWVNYSNTLVNNFNKVGGYTGTPVAFTKDSLNTGYFAMAERLDLCEIQNVATKMGVTIAKTGDPVAMNSLNSIIGTNAVSPLAMAGAYATVASGGTYCEPKVIDQITDANGNDLALPDRSCNQVLTPEVAATAAYALQSVMASGGTGSAANPFDGTPLLGKTGTHESWQTWMIESSTNVTTAVWVGNSSGDNDIFNRYYNGLKLSNLRYVLAKDTQATADSLYGGDEFPAPDSTLTRRVLTDLPSVIGMSIEQAQQTLSDAGFNSVVGGEVDGIESAGTIVSQNPGAGQTAGGTTVTISPSNGNGVSVPGVSGTVAQAQSRLSSAGLNPVLGTCTATGDDDDPAATGTSPAGGEVVSRGTTVSINYRAETCP